MMEKEKFTFLCMALCFFLFLPISAPAATVTIVNGQLMGATGVDVNGTLYDVEFVDGTADNLFDGVFVFATTTAATAASNALLNSVFIDTTIGGVEYDFDSNPGLTNGLAGNIDYGFILTPFIATETNTFSRLTRNHKNEIYDLVTAATSFASSWDTTDSGSNVYAVWQPVPIPGAVWLLGSGLIGLIGLKRKFKK